MGRPKKQKLVAGIGEMGQPLLQTATPALPFQEETSKPAKKKKVVKKVTKKIKDSDVHIIYLRSTVGVFKKIKEMADLNKVAFNDVANTILTNFFLTPKEFYAMKKENL